MSVWAWGLGSRHLSGSALGSVVNSETLRSFREQGENLPDTPDDDFSQRSRYRRAASRRRARAQLAHRARRAQVRRQRDVHSWIWMLEPASQRVVLRRLKRGRSRNLPRLIRHWEI